MKPKTRIGVVALGSVATLAIWMATHDMVAPAEQLRDSASPIAAVPSAGDSEDRTAPRKREPQPDPVTGLSKEEREKLKPLIVALRSVKMRMAAHAAATAESDPSKGSVVDASVKEGGLGNQLLDGCVVASLSPLIFDNPPEGEMNVTYPFTFTNEDEGDSNK